MHGLCPHWPHWAFFHTYTHTTHLTHIAVSSLAHRIHPRQTRRTIQYIDGRALPSRCRAAPVVCACPRLIGSHTHTPVSSLPTATCARWPHCHSALTSDLHASSRRTSTMPPSTCTTHRLVSHVANASIHLHNPPTAACGQCGGAHIAVTPSVTPSGGAAPLSHADCIHLLDCSNLLDCPHLLDCLHLLEAFMRNLKDGIRRLAHKAMVVLLA